MSVAISGGEFAQDRAVGFTKGMPFSDGYVAGNTLYVEGQQGPDSRGNVTSAVRENTIVEVAT
jgi:2-iminobutanoate/2-iminopropanoate deaminase